MENVNSSESFHYTYSSAQQEEIRQIRAKYAPREETVLERLQRLDTGATRPGTLAALAIGIISTLVLGVGMCCTMLWARQLFIPGIFIGLAGIAGVLSAYPVYTRITRRVREKLAPEILRLTDEYLQ